jgi:hypothetical protein
MIMQMPLQTKMGCPPPDIPLSSGSLDEKKQSGNARRIAIDENPFGHEGMNA